MHSNIFLLFNDFFHDLIESLQWNIQEKVLFCVDMWELTETLLLSNVKFIVNQQMLNCINALDFQRVVIPFDFDFVCFLDALWLCHFIHLNWKKKSFSKYLTMCREVISVKRLPVSISRVHMSEYNENVFNLWWLINHSHW